MLNSSWLKAIETNDTLQLIYHDLLNGDQFPDVFFNINKINGNIRDFLFNPNNCSISSDCLFLFPNSYPNYQANSALTSTIINGIAYNEGEINIIGAKSPFSPSNSLYVKFKVKVEP